MKILLELSALILSIVNGLMLLRHYLRDKPKLVVSTIHPDVYQWWFRLPDGEFKGRTTRRYGFLAYVSITNRGLRNVSLGSWRLFIRTKGLKRLELKPINISEPKSKVGEYIKSWPVLGQKGLLFDGDTVANAGCGVSGMAYYHSEFYGSELWNPNIKEGKIKGRFVVSDVFGKKAMCKIHFKEKPLKEISEMIEGIEKVP